ncbi:MAG: hypothetical protein Q9185_006794 [Variospora sp. 1 TL-2023]
MALFHTDFWCLMEKEDRQPCGLYNITSSLLDSLAAFAPRLPANPSVLYPALIRYHLHHPKTPRPLRFSRLRALRHWTIHRAAQLHLHAQRRQQELELERQYNAMRAACEELRVGLDDGGRLYRQATTRKGLFGGIKMEGEIVGNGGVPIEYAKAQVEGPPREGWDHGWKR